MNHAKALSPLPQVNEREVSRIGRWLASPLRASLGKLDHALASPFTIAQAIGTYYLRTIAREAYDRDFRYWAVSEVATRLIEVPSRTTTRVSS